MLLMEKENCILNNFSLIVDIIFSRRKHPHDRLVDGKMIIGGICHSCPVAKKM